LVLVSVVDPDPNWVRSASFCRIRIGINFSQIPVHFLYDIQNTLNYDTVPMLLMRKKKHCKLVPVLQWIKVFIINPIFGFGSRSRLHNDGSGRSKNIWILRIRNTAQNSTTMPVIWWAITTYFLYAGLCTVPGISTQVQLYFVNCLCNAQWVVWEIICCEPSLIPVVWRYMETSVGRIPLGGAFGVFSVS
jgi:hypothetical protein